METKPCAICGGPEPDTQSGCQCAVKYNVPHYLSSGQASIKSWTEMTKTYKIILPVHSNCLKRYRRGTKLTLVGLLIGPVLCIGSIAINFLLKSPTQWLMIPLALGFIALFLTVGISTIKDKRENERLSVWMLRYEPELWEEIKQPPEYVGSRRIETKFSVDMYVLTQPSSV
jgi:hypothetical protein